MSKELEFIKMMDLEENFEAFKTNPEWEIRIKFNEDEYCPGENLVLYRFGRKECDLSYGKFKIKDIYNIVYIIAEKMGCLISKEQLFDEGQFKYQVGYNLEENWWETDYAKYGFDASFIIDTDENAKKIRDLLDSSKNLKKWMGVKDEE